MCHTVCVLCLGNVYLSSFELGFEKVVKNFIKNFPCQRPNQLVRLKKRHVMLMAPNKNRSHQLKKAIALSP